MKRITLISCISLSLFITLFSSCKKSSATSTGFVCSTCKNTPDAIAANDNSSKGIYKGVLIGSTGTITFDINNSLSTITAVMVIDGVTANLTSTVQWTAGVAYAGAFTGTLSSQPITINFRVGETGQSPTVISSNIPGHPNAFFVIAKETSAALVEAFEGTFSTSKPESGTLNIILSPVLQSWYVIARTTGTNTVSSERGTLINNVLSNPNVTMGTVNGDQLGGTFTDNNGIVITFSGKRTL